MVLGAGSTLEGQAIPIKLNYKCSPKIVIPEHSESLLLHSNQNSIDILNKVTRNTKFDKNWFSNPPSEIPHYVIGPHFDEINPLLKQSVISQIDSVFKYDDIDWKEMSYKCFSNNLEIGNSSAANLFASKQLAEKGYKVLTFIYEPFRDFYHGHNMEAKNQILENSLEKVSNFL